MELNRTRERAPLRPGADAAGHAPADAGAGGARTAPAAGGTRPLTRAEHAPPTGARPRVDAAAGRLIGSRCAACGTRSWPARAICSACGSDELGLEPLPAAGTLTSYTTVWVPRAGLPTPYVLGHVDLGDGASVFAHVREAADGLTVPAAVRLVVAPDPADTPSFWFEPRQSQEAT